MILVPYQKFLLRSSLSKDQAIIKLTQSIDSDPPLLNWKFGKLQKPFEGWSYNGEFGLTKLFSNSIGGFPYVRGQIQPDEKGCTIDIIIKLRWYHLVGLSLGYTVMLVLFLYITLSTQLPLGIGIGLPFGFILLSYTISTLLFNFHASFLKDDLKEIFEVRDNG